METLLRVDHGFTTVCLLLNEDATKLNVERALDAACLLLARDGQGKLKGSCASPPGGLASAATPSGSCDGHTHGGPDPSLASRHPPPATGRPGVGMGGPGGVPVSPVPAVMGMSHAPPPGHGAAGDDDGFALPGPAPGPGAQPHMQQLVDCVSEAGRFVLYFAGHGIKVGADLRGCPLYVHRACTFNRTHVPLLSQPQTALNRTHVPLLSQPPTALYRPPPTPPSC
jgi:hypothetical protein